MAAAFLLFLTACGNKATDSRNITYQMGERVEVKSVIFSVIDSEWLASIGEGADQKLPKNRFLVLRLAVTNGTGAQVAVPMLGLEGGKGDPVMEVDDAKALPQWFGLIRLINPAQTEEGKLVFDVPPASYKLRVVVGNGDEEDSRLIEIPYAINDHNLVPGKK